MLSNSLVFVHEQIAMEKGVLDYTKLSELSIKSKLGSRTEPLS